MADLDLAGVAARCGRSYGWMAEHWRTLRHPGSGALFPRPYVGALKHQRPRWLADQVEAWKAGDLPRTAAHPTQREPAPHADNDPVQRQPTDAVAALLAAAGG